MLRITVQERSENTRTVKVEGRLAGQSNDEFQRVCDDLLTARCTLTFDLTDVLFADDAGVRTLHNLVARGATIDHCSPFITEQLRGGHS